MSSQNNIVTVKNSQGYVTQISSGKNSIIAESGKSGGTNENFNPYELLISALGSCVAITMRMYAERKNYPLKDIEIKLINEKIYAEDCAECETKEGKLDKIDIEIKLTGDLTDDQRKAILDISEKCPVHRTLTSEIKICAALVN